MTQSEDTDTNDSASTVDRAHNYFQLLEIANETASRPTTPPLQDRLSPEPQSTSGIAEGYFKTFFKEEARLGMGAGGSVYLCQHVLDGNPLGRFAVKKIAVGDSHEYLGQILREVRLLEQLRHPNVISYHHAWIEPTQFSSFGPRIMTLHVLMQWAEAGSLDGFLSARLGHSRQQATTSQPDEPKDDTRSARIRAFKAAKAGGDQGRRSQANSSGWKTVHYLSPEEISSLMKDIVEGLSFLHDKSILHLDLKSGNILLTYEEGRLTPRAMLCDFGTSRDMLSSNTRTGNTGTLEYAAPESLSRSSNGGLRPADSKADMWSLGMVLHRLLFLRLPYETANRDAASDSRDELTGPERMEKLEQEVLEYPGFKSDLAILASFKARRIPESYIVLLEKLLDIKPASRPGCDKILQAFREKRFDPAADPSIQLEAALVPAHSFARRLGETSPTRAITGHSPEVDHVDASVEAVDRSLTPQPRSGGLGKRVQAHPTPSLATRSPNYNPFISKIIGRRLVDDPALRLAKSCILIAKTWSIQRIQSRIPVTSVVALGVLALADTAVDNWWMCLALGVIHIVVLMLVGP